MIDAHRRDDQAGSCWLGVRPRRARVEGEALAALPPFTLMARAGEAVARLAIALVPHARRIVVFAGPGNNGGDGIEAATRLRLGQADDGDSRRRRRDASSRRGSGARPRARGRRRDPRLRCRPAIGRDPPRSVIDALLGIGASRAPRARSPPRSAASQSSRRSARGSSRSTFRRASTPIAASRSAGLRHRRRHAHADRRQARPLHRQRARPRRANLVRRLGVGADEGSADAWLVGSATCHATSRRDAMRATRAASATSRSSAAPGMSGAAVGAAPVEGMTILYDDDDLVVVDKPVGVAAHPSPGWDGPTVIGGLAAAGYRISTSGAAERQGVVHRLDAATTGRHGGRQERAGLHRAEGGVQGAHGRARATTRWCRDTPIRRAAPSTRRSTGTRGTTGGSPSSAAAGPSVTHYEVIEAFPAASLVDIQLETGRTHQIRVHFSALRHPCVGDTDLRRRPDAGRAARRRAAVAARRPARLPAPRRRPLGRVHQRLPARPRRRAGRPARRDLSPLAVSGLPGSLADFGPAALAAVVVAGYLVVGEPVVGHVLHRRFEGRLRTDPGARRSFYRRLLVLEWGLALLALVVWLAAPGRRRRRRSGCAGRSSGRARSPALVVVARAGLRRSSPRGRCAAARCSRRAEPRRAGPGRAGTPSRRAHATLALLPRTPGERRLFTSSGVTAGVCEEWLYRGFFLAVVAALAGGLPTGVARRSSRRSPSAWRTPTRARSGIVTTGVLGGVMAALYLQTGSLLLPVLLHAAIDLRFLLVPARALPGRPGGGVSRRAAAVAGPADWPEIAALRHPGLRGGAGRAAGDRAGRRRRHRGARAQPGRRRPGGRHRPAAAGAAAGAGIGRMAADPAVRGRGHGAAVLAELHRQAAAARGDARSSCTPR